MPHCSEAWNTVSRYIYTALPEVTEVRFRPDFAEVYVNGDPGDEALKRAVEGCGGYTVTNID